MFKKRLKGLLAMLLAGSIAATALPLTASATISGNISIADAGGGTVYPNDITCTSGDYSFKDLSYDAISGDLGSNYLWAINADKGGTESGYIITTAKGDELAEKLYGLKESSTEYENVKIKKSHKVLVTTADPSVTDTDVSGAANVSEFPHEISFSDFGFTPINNPLQEATCTVWYGAEFGNTVDRYSVEKGASYAISGTEIEIPMSTVENIYKPVSGGSTIPFGIGVTIIQLQNSYKTFEIPVYNGWGEATNQKISVTQTNTDNALKDLNGAALKGKYVLVYDETQYDNDSNYITNKDELWSVIGVVADEKGTFDVRKAKLVRYVRYDAVIGNFTSVDLLNEVADNRDINYLNERKDSGSIWKISCSVIDPTDHWIYPHKFVYGDSFDAGIKEFLNEYNCDTVSLRNKTELHITATDPSTQVNPYGGFKLTDKYITIDTDKQYPVKVSDLAAKLTAEISPTAGMKYNKDEWELWPCYTSTGSITMDRKATVADPTADIGIPHYELALEQYHNDLLVYFKQVAIAPAVTVTKPAAGATPATTATVPENDGYSVDSVKWYDGETKLTASDTFAGGKQYTVKVTLKPDTGLQFIDDTKVTINGNAVSKTLNQDGTLTVSYTFPETEPEAVTSVELNVTAPVFDKTPDTSATLPDNAGYTVSNVSWSPADEKFKEDTAYTVSATVKANDGFKFTEDTTAKINGADATIKAGENGSYIVSYTFPKTAKAGLTGIKVTAPTKTKYKVGESIDVTGGKVTLIYEGSKTEEISLTEDMLTYDNSKAGKATVTVKYDKFEDTFEVEFEKVTVDPTEPTDNQPQIKGDNGKTGWDAISDAIADADDGDTVIIDMNGTTVLPEGILNDIAGRDIDIVLDIGGGFTWTINGTTVTNPTTIDMGVNTDSSIPVKVINALTGECSYITISLAHNGEFGFTAVLTVELGEKNKGLFANLYYYNDSTEKTEFVLSDIIDADGKADLTFTHASEYVIVIDDHDHGKAADDSSTTSDTTSDSDTNPSTGIPMISGVALVAGAAIMMISRKKKK